ncbi:hypothetical protein Acr_06g0010470 [Actinidia rufa]|uniref:F-box domain-containing protein n=1 Tax=Actinidia rufa TaxID=165716 RepID=A0A7J0EU55_9ERIC|nr:hypothetical protein Acr_06g0010470 [Actinidia rufa]
MVLQCLTWIPHLWDQLLYSVTIHKNGFVRPLPEEIIIDILSRLPADCVLECRVVCRKWLALTSTPYFVEMHCKRAAPFHFVQSVYDSVIKNELDLFIIFDGVKKDKMIERTRAGYMHLKRPNMPLLYGSCNKLLLFRPRFDGLMYFVCNAVTREQITLTSPVDPGMLCGFFFHLPMKEYRELAVRKEGTGFRYYMYSLVGKLGRRIAAFSYPPTSFVTPTIVNGALHWTVEHKSENEDIPPCTDAVRMFNMDNEDFRSMPHPGKECHSQSIYEKMCLLEMKRKLSFCSIYARLIDIWVLEDYENWYWNIVKEVDGAAVKMSDDLHCFHIVTDYAKTFVSLTKI